MKDNIELSYFTTIEFSGDAEPEEEGDILPLAVQGVSVKKGYIKTKNFILTEKETVNIAKTLKKGVDGNGAYILKDHGFKSGGGIFGGLKSVDNLIGRISDTEAKGGVVTYKGELSADEELAKKVRSGLVCASSVGLRAKSVYCSICGKKYGDCGHFLGEKYPEEELHESVAEFLEEMGGVPVAALVGKGMSGIEQSIVLFPAIKEATVGEAFSMNFSEGTNEFITEMEKLKREAIENLALNGEKVAKPLVLAKAFNKDNVHTIDSEQSTMSEREIELSNEIVGLKVELETAGNDKTSLEAQISEKDGSIEKLTTDLSDVRGELITNKALLKEYQDAEATELAEKTKNVEEAIVAMAEERKLGVVYDFEKMTLAGKEGVLKTLEASKVIAQGTLPGEGGAAGVELSDEEKRELEKEEIRKRIFGDK